LKGERIVKVLIFGSLLFLLTGFLRQSLAQPAPSVDSPPAIQSSSSSGEGNPPPTDESTGPHVVHFLSDYEFWLTMAVMIFGVFVVVLEYRLLSRVKAAPTDIIRVLAVTLILVGSLFLITAGYSNNQIGPVSGLFGTIAGYLLGKSPGLARRAKKASIPPTKEEQRRG
jgi:predicted tellurium resistance membrane protein TerC